MASHRELTIDWNMLDHDCNNWTLQDLQLAAELGRTLLERNEELESELKQQQTLIDDQGQEIEFLSKQVNSMKEESANRAKIYEQLESSICELEKTNSQLSRKHEVDKKRIQSLCENIEYLERKCEELNVTLQSMRNEQGKKTGSQGKVNRSSYFSFGSDSSEEEMSAQFGIGMAALFRRRSHSLQDLRDYTPSPDEFDSGNSNSPDSGLKTSESEFIDSLENRIEELMSSKKKEMDKVRQLETQIKLLIQENANLQQQIVQISNEKEEEISELRRHLQDSSSYNSQLNSSFSVPLSSTRRNSESNNSTTTSSGGANFSHATSDHHLTSDPILPYTSLGIGSSISSSSNICKRCSAEITVFNLVTSIENDNTEEIDDWEFGSPEDDMEYSSLEHELAKANGTPFTKDNRFINGSNHPGHRFVLSPNSNPLRYFNYNINNNNNNNNNSISIASSPTKRLARSRKLREYLRNNPSQIDIEEMDYENSEIFDIFLGHDDKDEIGEDALGEHSPTRVKFSSDVHDNGTDADTSSTSLSTDEEAGSDSRMDEDPCLIKDRKPEFAKSKLGKSKLKKSKTSSKIPGGTVNTVGCVSSDILMEPEKSPIVVSTVVKNSSSSSPSKFLKLPTRIPSDDEIDDPVSSFQARVSSAVGDQKARNNAREDPQVDQDEDEESSLKEPEISSFVCRCISWAFVWLMGVAECLWFVFNFLFFMSIAVILPGSGRSTPAITSPPKHILALTNSKRLTPKPLLSSRKL